MTDLETCPFGNVNPDGSPICQPVFQLAISAPGGDGKKLPIREFEVTVCLDPRCQRSPAFGRTAEQIVAMERGNEEILYEFSV